MLQKLKNYYHLIQAVLANIIYGFPSRKLKVISITGTDGKTTTTHLIAHILKTAGKKTSFVSSVYASIGGVESDIGFHVTTPNSFALQKILKKSYENKDEYFVLETTSHALDQNRVWGIKFEIGVVTNITHEHLDYHRTFQEYVRTKSKLFKNANLAILNEEDESYEHLKNHIAKIKKKNKILKVYSFTNRFKNLKNIPAYNQANYSAAQAVCRRLGISDEIISDAIKTFVLPKGRLDLVYNQSYGIIIDFAHTPNALEKLLPAVKKLYLKNGGRLIHVFGSAGLRDYTKRPLMGKASARYADIIIITEEDYRTEDPAKISQQISEGIKDKDFQIILDRQMAINKAVALAKRNDLIVLTGKSHEKSLCRGSIEYPWNEYEAVEKALSNKMTNDKTQVSSQ